MGNAARSKPDTVIETFHVSPNQNEAIINLPPQGGHLMRCNYVVTLQNSCLHIETALPSILFTKSLLIIII